MIQLNKISKAQEIKNNKKYVEKVGCCQYCRHIGEDNVVHHLEKKLSHPELRHKESNWFVLCFIDHRVTEVGGVCARGVKWTAKEFNDHLKELKKII